MHRQLRVVARATPTASRLLAKRRALVTLHTRYVRDAMATNDTDARRAAFESAHDIDHALRAIDARLETIEPVPQPIELHTRLYDV